MKIVWVTRSFLDYRVPVFIELNKLLNGKLHLVYNADYIPERVHDKIQEGLGENAIGLRGEYKFGAEDFGDFLANKKIRIPFQPGLVKMVKSLNPDVLITDGFFQWTYAALWLRKFNKIPHVMCYERTSHTERNAQGIRTKYRKLVSKYIDIYCASGKLCGEYLGELGIDKKNITYGHMVADVSGIAKKSVLRSSKNSLKTYLYVGKLIERKGINQLLEAWKVFQDKKEEQVALQIVGDGELKDFVIDYCEKHKINTIELLGFVDYDKMYKIYAQADVFLIPTLEDNWSLVVPEAMSNGLPILCSKYNGCWPEYVTESNGWVFDPLDRENFINQLNQSYLCGNLNVMGEKSKDIISNHTPKNAALNIFNTIKLAKIK